MEETREQPIIMPATALNAADEKSAMSEVGSQDMNMGKFKSVQALMDAYNNLQAEFTKKCQKLSQLQKDKTNSALPDLDLQDIADFENNLTQNEEKQLKNEEKTDYNNYGFKCYNTSYNFGCFEILLRAEKSRGN